jgi:hypothetical protein
MGCVLVGASHYCLRSLPSEKKSYEAAVTGSFQARPPEAVEHLSTVPIWDSGSRNASGSVSIGPFPAPDRLKFAVRADSGAEHQEVYLELQIIKIRIPVTIAHSGQWEIVNQEMPFGWRGRLITLNASTGAAGGLAVSQPFGRLTGGTRQYGLMETVTAWLANGLLYGALFITVARFVAQREIVKPCWVAIAACAAMAVVGYVTFWAYFASPTLGRFFSGSVFLLMLLINVVFNRRFEERDREWLRVGCTAVLIGVLYIGILHLFPVHRDFYDLASNRFTAGLPGDNRLPFDFASQLYHGERPKELGAGWLSSDRPPLQEGWQLIAWPLTEALGFSSQTASATASLWFQLSWVFALYGLLRSMKIQGRRALLWTAAASLNGVFLLHSVYTWPKLSAAAFVCAGFGMWLLDGCGSRFRAVVLGSLFAALGYLTHGGAAFSLIPLVPWIAWRWIKGEHLPWILAAIVFALTVAPWTAYQRFYAPPGNRLLKWHLAGDFNVDDKPLWATISDAYGSQSWDQIMAKRTSNLSYQLEGDWRDGAAWTAGSVEARRSEEYFHTFRALGWWNFAVPAFIVSLAGFSFRKGISAPFRRQSALGAWIVSTMVIWCMLMFTQTEIAQGSLAVMVALFALYASRLEAAGRWWIACIGALQAYTLMTTWMPGNSVINGPLSGGAVALIALALAGGLASLLRLHPPGADGGGEIGEGKSLGVGAS